MGFVSSCSVLSAKLRSRGVITAAVLAVRVSGFNKAHGEEWLALQPIPCRDNGSGRARQQAQRQLRDTLHRCTQRQHGWRHALTVGFWCGGPRINIGRHGVLRKFSIKNPHDALLLSSNEYPQKTASQTSAEQTVQCKTSLLSNGDRQRKRSPAPPPVFSRCTVSAEENTDLY